MSLNSPTSICNLALSLVGMAPVSNVKEPKTTVETILNGIYDTARQNIYNDCYFQFSMNFINLPAEVVAEEKKEYSIRFPKDFIRLVRLYKDKSFIPNNGRNFRIFDNRIYSHFRPPYEILYVADVIDANLMTSDFKLLLAANLIRLGVSALGLTKEKTQNILNLYETEMQKAKNNNAINNPPMIIDESDYVEAYEYPNV
jgi:hypothetical protein